MNIDLQHYQYSWGAHGIPLAFESMLSHAMTQYAFIDMVSVSIDDDLRVYWNDEARNGAEAYGRSVYASMESAIEHLSHLKHAAEFLRVLTDVDESDDTWRAYTEQAMHFLRYYMTLDPEFTDTHLRGVGDHTLLAYLGEQKNAYREVINELFFVRNCIFLEMVYARARTMDIQDKLQATRLTLPELMGEEPIRKNELDERHDWIVWSRASGVTYDFDTQEAVRIKQALARCEGQPTTTWLAGQTVAKKAHVRGTVRLCDTNYGQLSEEIDRLNALTESFVFVADHTTPELVPIMKRSLAIVTNMGGILSHAAITARELDVPCIVGTKIATQVLRDGDLIEVDAGQGVVTILERAPEK